MKKILFSLFSLLFLLISNSPVLAHPGRTDSTSGCHTCRTNCGSWGLSYGEYHCHGGSTYVAPVVTKAPTVAPTRVYTPTPTPTKKITPTPTVSGESTSSSDFGGLLTVLGLGGGIWYWKNRKRKNNTVENEETPIS